MLSDEKPLTSHALCLENWKIDLADNNMQLSAPRATTIIATLTMVGLALVIRLLGANSLDNCFARLRFASCFATCLAILR